MRVNTVIKFLILGHQLEQSLHAEVITVDLALDLH